ncbi:hypothetical protein HGQ17_02915 [Nesterenkonia sp. MY13]|uniref:Uncharacterized protein n=1 Tax=Nesterenkonia sedimenti TaxID=1463632 RepID=A0A7X8TIA4_9MICC|nr:hypothetical protein [Nesterenkonia sedimenti]NLS08970.1 hypothetical protein [Nesterenkonia sedimenti]
MPETPPYFGDPENSFPALHYTHQSLNSAPTFHPGRQKALRYVFRRVIRAEAPATPHPWWSPAV